VVFGVSYAEKNEPFERLGCEKEVLFKKSGEIHCPILLIQQRYF
jgi:hypothetical protein